MAEIAIYSIYAIAGLGTLIVGIPILLITLQLWFVAIPIVGFILGGAFGFFFAVGLVTLILFMWASLVG